MARGCAHARTHARGSHTHTHTHTHTLTHTHTHTHWRRIAPPSPHTHTPHARAHILMTYIYARTGACGTVVFRIHFNLSMLWWFVRNAEESANISINCLSPLMSETLFCWNKRLSPEATLAENTLDTFVPRACWRNILFVCSHLLPCPPPPPLHVIVY